MVIDLISEGKNSEILFFLEKLFPRKDEWKSQLDQSLLDIAERRAKYDATSTKDLYRFVRNSLAHMGPMIESMFQLNAVDYFIKRFPLLIVHLYHAKKALTEARLDPNYRPPVPINTPPTPSPSPSPALLHHHPKAGSNSRSPDASPSSSPTLSPRRHRDSYQAVPKKKRKKRNPKKHDRSSSDEETDDDEDDYDDYDDYDDDGNVIMLSPRGPFNNKRRRRSFNRY